MAGSNSARGRRARKKGTRGELDLAHACEAIGIACERSARNGVTSAEDMQHALAGFMLESKRREQLALPAWIRKLEAEAGELDLRPLLAFRRNREPWRLVVRLEDLPALCEAYASAIGRPVHPPARGAR